MDRTVKVLFALIAIALWGLLLRPYLSLPAAQAAPSALPSAGVPAIAVPLNTSEEVIVVQNGNVYRIDCTEKMTVTGKVALR